MARGELVIAPNLGLYLGRPPLMVPERGLQDGRNFRIKDGRLSNVGLGWRQFSAVDFGGPVLLIELFTLRGIDAKQIVATHRDIFEYDQSADTAAFLNPRYAVGTVNVSSADPAVVTVQSGTPQWVTNGIKAGDFISFGSAAERSPTADWYEIASVDGESQLTLTTAVDGAPLSDQAYTIRRTFTGMADNAWITDIFVAPDDGAGGFGDDLWFATNGVDPVVTWDGQASEVTLHPELGFRCKHLRAYKNMMVYANLVYGSVTFPTSYVNSDVGKPLAAGDTGTGLSEQFRIHDGNDEIKRVERLGDNLVFYSERHVTLVQFVGDPFVFIQRDVANDVGLVGSRLIANFGDYHEFIGQDSQYLFDGVQVVEIGKQVWRHITRLRDPVRHEMGFAHFDEDNGELIWAIALTSDARVSEKGAPPEVAFVEHYLEEVGERTSTPFSMRDMPFYCLGDGRTGGTLTWDRVTIPWDEFTIRWNDGQLFDAFPLVLGGKDGKIMLINGAQLQDGKPYPSFVRFGRRVLGDRRQRGLLSRVYPYVRQNQAMLKVTTRFYDHPSGETSRSQVNEFDMRHSDGERYFVTPYRRGRFFDVEFGTEGDPWELDGYDVDIRPGGER